MAINQFVTHKTFLLLLLASVLSAVLPSVSIAAQPSNPNANQEARAVLNWMESLRSSGNNRLMFGQFAGWRDGPIDKIENIYSATGKYPAIVGMPALRPGSTQLKTQPRLDSIYMINYFKNGGILQIDDFGLNPWTGKGDGDKTGASPESAGELFKTGTAANKFLMNWLSNTANELQKYEDAGVVVLWRPYHEMNMGWNWWSALGISNYKKLYQFMHNYFTNTRKLDNILWVYAPSGLRGAPGERASEWYPGDSYVDIVSADFYSDFLDDPVRDATRWFKGDFYPWAVSTGKPIGLSEYGRSINPPFDQLEGYLDIVKEAKSEFPALVFIIAWDDKDRDLAKNNAAGAFADPYVMTRDEVDWKSFAGSLEPPSTPSGLTIITH